MIKSNHICDKLWYVILLIIIGIIVLNNYN